MIAERQLVRLNRYGKHAKRCECPACIRFKFDTYRARVEAMHGVIPEDTGLTIPVRAHWRRGKNHLKQSPVLRSMVQELVSALIRAHRRKAS